MRLAYSFTHDWLIFLVGDCHRIARDDRAYSHGIRSHARHGEACGFGEAHRRNCGHCDCATGSPKCDSECLVEHVDMATARGFHFRYERSFADPTEGATKEKETLVIIPT